MNEYQPMSRREARELERAQATGEVSIPSPLPEPVDFNPNGSLNTGGIDLTQAPDVDVKTIVVEELRDPTDLTLVLPDSGSILTTGAIELPWLNQPDPVTDTAPVLEDAARADAATSAERSSGSTHGIEPVAARVHTRTRRKASVFPTRLRKGWGVVHLMLVSAFLLLVITAALAAAIVLGVIKLY